MAKPKVKEVIVVEGRYDKNTLSQVVDAVIVELGGFAVFNDKEKQAFLRKLAKERGIILFTDPDGAVRLCSCEQFTCDHIGKTVDAALLRQIDAGGSVIGAAGSGEALSALYSDSRILAGVPIVSAALLSFAINRKSHRFSKKSIFTEKSVF